MQKAIIYFFLLTCLFSCKEEPKHIQEAYRVMKNFTNYMENSEHFYLISSGGEMMNQINQISLTYEAQRHVDINEARKLFLLNSNKLLNLINKDNGIRSYLHSYPFAIKDARLKLIFCDKKGAFVPSEYIACVFCVHDKVCYYNFDLTINNLKQVFEEPYEEALEIFNSQN